MIVICSMCHMTSADTSIATDRGLATRPLLTFENPGAELIFGIVCAVGGNYKRVQVELTRLLRKYGYETTVIRLSSLLPVLATRIPVATRVENTPEYNRIFSHMQVGNELRRGSNSPALLALAAVSEISRLRSRSANMPEPQARHAYVLLTLKRKEEADILRRVYGSGFFLIGVYATEQERRASLKDDFGMSAKEAQALIAKDEDDSELLGQQTRSVFHRADVFVRLSSNGYKRQLQRFLECIFRHPYHTPTQAEYGMFLAYSASLRLAQLGRQVGASIVSAHGDIVSVGCNEVPKAGGGSYWPGEYDMRDHILGEDSNDTHKAKIAMDIVQRLGLAETDRPKALKSIRKSLLFDITEFGRAVHAEMDAILSCARSGVSPIESTLYTTTFPCHNCARHIVAAGIRRVVFIEPYPKSKAPALHNDSIRLDESGKKTRVGTRIPFEPFVGIGPRRYAELFATRLAGGFEIPRKRDGKVIEFSEAESSPRMPLQPVSYLQREQLVADELERIISEGETRR